MCNTHFVWRSLVWIESRCWIKLLRTYFKQKTHTQQIRLMRYYSALASLLLQRLMKLTNFLWFLFFVFFYADVHSETAFGFSATALFPFFFSFSFSFSLSLSQTVHNWPAWNIMNEPSSRSKRSVQISARKSATNKKKKNTPNQTNQIRLTPQRSTDFNVRRRNHDWGRSLLRSIQYVI